MALMSKPTRDPKVSRWWWRTLREWVYELVDPLWGAFRGENTDEISLANVTAINGVSTAELAVLDGLTATTAELNKLSGLTADATDLNKTDRTQADGVAEASKAVVLDANKDILGKRYDINQSLLGALAGEPFYRLDGSNDYIDLGDSNRFSFGDGAKDSPFSLEWFGVIRDAINHILVSKDAASNREYTLLMDSQGKLLINLIDNSAGASIQSKYGSALTSRVGERLHILCTYDGSGLNTGLKIYLNGVSVGDAPGGSGSYTAMENLAADFYLGRTYSTYSEGDIYRVRIFNRELTADEVLPLASGAPLDYADAGADQTDLVINGDDWTGASGSTPPTGWSDSGSGTAGYTIRDNTGVTNMDSATLELGVIGSGSKTLYQAMLQPGKRYRVTFVYRNLDGSSSTIVALGTSSNSVALQNTTISGDGVLFEQELVADGTDLLFEVAVDGILQIDQVQVVQIGCVAEYRPDGITAAQWQDTSGNQLHGSVNGAVPLNLPSNHVARYVKTGITGDTTLSNVVPAGYRIKSIIVKETAGSAITGGLKIGSTAGGTQVVNGQAVPANAQAVDCTLGTRIWSTTNPQTLYVEDVTSWNSASIDLSIQMERVS